MKRNNGRKEGDLITPVVRDYGAGIPDDRDGKNTSSPGMRPVNSRIDPGEETITPDRTNVTLFTITLDEKQQFLDQDAWIVADLSQVFS
jgi:two-component sensor histidine kinase